MIADGADEALNGQCADGGVAVVAGGWPRASVNHSAANFDASRKAAEDEPSDSFSQRFDKMRRI